MGRLHLSAFGRTFAASGYALSQMLYNYEFMGLPPSQQLDALRRQTAAFVGRAMTPAAYAANPVPGCPAWVTPSCPFPRPVHGDFGLLPLVEHVRARNAFSPVERFMGNAALAVRFLA